MSDKMGGTTFVDGLLAWMRFRRAFSAIRYSSMVESSTSSSMARGRVAAAGVMAGGVVTGAGAGGGESALCCAMTIASWSARTGRAPVMRSRSA